MKRSEEQARLDLETIYRAGVQRVHPRNLIPSAVQLERERLTICTSDSKLEFDLGRFDRIVVLGAGKGAAAMAASLEVILKGRIADGIVVTKYGHAEPLRRIRLWEAAHPVPDESGVQAAREVARLAQQADERTLVLTLLSGGGSALLAAPFQDDGPGCSLALRLEDKQTATRALLSCGATIQEINCVRKHLSALKGGRLAALLYPAYSINLIISDVVGDSLSAVASGPTVADQSTYGEAWSIVRKYSLDSMLPASVVKLLSRGVAGELPETPKIGDSLFERVNNVLLGGISTAVEAAASRAIELGYSVVVLSSRIEGEAREIAKVFAAIAIEQRRLARLGTLPLCLLSGGEPTVTIRGNGLGGRNQELALSFLAQLEQAEITALDGITFLSGATDGNDGPTDAAGAFASATVLRQARLRGLQIDAHLANNDSYRFHEVAGSLFKTGPTNTNVCDLQLCLVY